MTSTATRQTSVVEPAALESVLRSGPPVGVSAGPLGVVQAADREIGRQTARQIRAVVAFAATRPASADRPAGTPGAMSAAARAARPLVLEPVSEWAAQEVSVALSVTQYRAVELLEQSLLVAQRLPSSLTALEAGTIHPGHLAVLRTHVAPIPDDRIRASVEADLLRWLAGSVKTPAQLADRARRVVLRADATAAARRLERALAGRGVYLSPGREAGTEQLTAVLSTPEARACMAVLGAYADTLDDAQPDEGDRPADSTAVGGAGSLPRSRAQKMADVLLDLILRPGQTDRPIVQAQLTLVASIETMAGGDGPGEVDGQVVPAAMVRHLAQRLGLLPDEPDSGHAPAAAPAPAPAAAEAPITATGAPVQATRTVTDAAVPSEAGSDPAAGADDWVDADDWGADDPGGVPSSGDWPEDDGPACTEQQRAFLEALWAMEAGPIGVPAPSAAGSVPVADPPSWAAADTAVQLASRAVEDARCALGDATGLVYAAEAHAFTGDLTWARSAAGRLSYVRSTTEALAWLSADQRDSITDLLTRTAGGGLTDRPRIALVDALTGTLLALTDAPELRRTGTCGRPACARRHRACTHDLSDQPGLGPPPETHRYRPSAALDRFVRARDPRCRFPGCRTRVPRDGELDHRIPYPDGPTTARNLDGYCTRHHRGKHQAPGWTHTTGPDGRLTIDTPGGLRITVAPHDHRVGSTASASHEAAGAAHGDAYLADDHPPF